MNQTGLNETWPKAFRVGQLFPQENQRAARAAVQEILIRRQIVVIENGQTTFKQFVKKVRRVQKKNGGKSSSL